MILRYDPFRELDRLSRQVWGPGSYGSSLAGLALDVHRYDDHVEAVFDLPGVSPESIELTVEKDTLTVKAERQAPQIQGAQVLVNERQFGEFTRQLSLGQALDTDKVAASYKDGVLTVTVPIAEQAKARKIEISTQSSTGSIEAKSTEAA